MNGFQVAPAAGGHTLAQVALPDGARRVDLTRATVALDPAVAVVSLPAHGRVITDEAEVRWTALGLALTSADLVGTMRGTVQLAVDCAKGRRRYGTPIGSFQAVQHLLADARRRRRGRGQRRPARRLGSRRAAGRRRARRRRGGRALPSVYHVIVDEELAGAGGPPRPSLGYMVQGILEHGSDDIRRRFPPGIVNGRDRWCQGFSEPDAGSDLASLRTRAGREGDEHVITGHKVWTSYSDVADWCMVLARTDPDVPAHKGISAFRVSVRQPGIEQRPLRMINGITSEFGEVLFDGARVPASDMIGDPGEGRKLAMTVVSHEREPGELGYVARYKKLVNELTGMVRDDPDRYASEQVLDLAWAVVEAEVLRLHVCRRLSDRLDGISHGPEGSVDKLLMTQVEQAVGHAALAVGAAPGDGDDTWLKVYLYSRAQSVMGGTSHIQRNLIARRILELPTS